ncbi:MAG: hypothetical protein H0V22_03835 [Solirubrobacterales bacterium]|nr:hypothetical protein [Solirubrobacterales bacterium]
MESRAERLALNEAAFRVANERAREWEERHQEMETELYLCECGDLSCPERIPLSREAYESVRSDSRRFFCAPGHQITDVETVIERHEHYVVVEKDPEVARLVTETDPRQP